MARGFASMSAERRRELSRLGGFIVHHEYGTGRKWTREEAIRAGEIGRANRAKRRAEGEADETARVR